jgi:hypothetical protein
MALQDADQQILNDLVEKHKDFIMNMGIYDHLGRAQAVNGHGLYLARFFMADYLQLVPQGTVVIRMFQEAVLQVVIKMPSLNSSDWKNAIFAGSKVERCTTVLHHLRRVAGDKIRHRQMAGKMTGNELVELTKVMQMLVVELPAAKKLTASSEMETPSPKEGPQVKPAFSPAAKHAKIDMTGGQLKAAMDGSKKTAKPAGEPAAGGAKKTKKSAAGGDRLSDVLHMGRKYNKMFYKANNSYGIRIAGGAQIISICDKSLDVTALAALALQATNTLNSHKRTEKAVYTMVMHKLGR